jgi:hypothetical protein
MPKILLPNGATRWVPVLNPGDVLASGEKSALDRVGIAGQESSQISSASVVAQGQDENAPAVAGPVPSIFSPRLRQATRPDTTLVLESQRRTTRPRF